MHYYPLIFVYNFCFVLCHLFVKLVTDVALIPGLLFVDPFSKQSLVFMCLQYIPFENNVGKGEIAHYEQFLLFSQCFLSLLGNFLSFSSNLKMSI